LLLLAAALHGGSFESGTCPPEGGRYMNHQRVVTKILQSEQFLRVPAKDEIHVAHR
jgi:hypothetical protein